VELRQLATFVAVAENGNFTRAADRLHVVQSAVSVAAAQAAKDPVAEARGGLRGTVMLGTMHVASGGAQGMRAFDLAGMLAAFRAGNRGRPARSQQSR
jgi:Bacterial regulatory helix-turn-helix protein, lysR family